MPFLNLAADSRQSEISYEFYEEAVAAGFIPQKEIESIEKSFLQSEDEGNSRANRGLSLGKAWSDVNYRAHKWAKGNKDKGYIQNW